MRLIIGFEVDENAAQPNYAAKANEWFKSRKNQALAELNDSFEKYRMSEALMTVYKLIWDDYCSWYLEMIKPPFGEKIDAKTKEEAILFFEELLILVHPFMPFVTEEIWHQLRNRADKETIMFQNWPSIGHVDQDILEGFAFFENAVSGIRTIRKDKNIPFKEAIKLSLNPGPNHRNDFNDLIVKLGNISKLEIVNAEVEDAFAFAIGSTVGYIPAAGFINVEEEIAKLEKDLEYNQGFLNSVMKKLGNERFVSSAPPAIVEAENKKRADAEAKIASITEQVLAFKK